MLVAGCAQEVPPSEPPPLSEVASVLQLMKSVLEPAAEIYMGRSGDDHRLERYCRDHIEHSRGMAGSPERSSYHRRVR